MGRPSQIYPMSPLQEALVQIIRTELHDRGWSQLDLAAASGYSPKHVSRVLCGKGQGTLECWDGLLTAVGRNDYAGWR